MPGDGSIFKNFKMYARENHNSTRGKKDSTNQNAIPRLRIFEMHSLTIANIDTISDHFSTYLITERLDFGFRYRLVVIQLVDLPVEDRDFFEAENLAHC